MPFTQSAGARIHWDSQGSGTPVLLIMGHLYSGRMWRPLLPALTQQHRAIFFDNRGTGESDTTRDTTIGQLAADALAVLDAAGAERAHVYGVSLGGAIAAEFAMRYPGRVTSLVLGCTRMKTTPGSLAPGISQLVYYLPRGLVRTLLRSRSAYGPAAPADAVDADLKLLAGERFTMAGARAQSAAMADYVTTPEAVGRLAMPTLVLHGDEDGAVDVKYGREFAAAIPGSRLVIFPGAGHNYLVAANQASTAAVLDFFDEVDRAPGPSTAPTPGENAP